ncbi:MAG: patatin-like phospholipase RssA [Mariprofundus sp.]|nr:patatin-like phospholipase RssA [Mariprofundus sp.]
MEAARAPCIGLALGSGSARGWSHIGVIRALADLGIEPDIVCGSSIGALVGASLACGRIDALEHWLGTLSVRDMIKLLDVSLLGGGLIQGNKLAQACCAFVEDVDIETLALRFGAVATDLQAGREEWFRQGRLLDAVRASMALPGLFPPFAYQGRWLVDGGLVNPVPISMCRAMGAEIVIAVNLNNGLIGNSVRAESRETRLTLGLLENELIQKLVHALEPVKERVESILPLNKAAEDAVPGMFESMTGAIDIMQDRITKSRLAGDPPDILISPLLAHMGLLEFDRSSEAIAEGEQAVKRAFDAGALNRLSERALRPSDCNAADG